MTNFFENSHVDREDFYAQGFGYLQAYRFGYARCTRWCGLYAIALALFNRRVAHQTAAAPPFLTHYGVQDE